MCEIKKCSRCKRELPADKFHFYAVSHTDDKFHSACKECEGHKFSRPKPIEKEGHKICTKCGVEKELTIEFFHKVKINKDGFCGQCRVCVREYKATYNQLNKEFIVQHKKQYYLDNKEAIDEYRRLHAEENRDIIASRARAYGQKNKEVIAARGKLYRESNRNNIKERRKLQRNEHKEAIAERAKRYNEENKEKIAINKKKYLAENIESIHAYKKIYRQNNKRLLDEKAKVYRKENRESHNISEQRREAKKRSLPYSLTVHQWADIKNHFNNECCYCGRRLPLAKDHFLALNNGGEFTINNIVPSCISCNSSKKNKDFKTWFPNFIHYSKLREQKILNYLGYVNGIQQLSLL